MKKFDNIGQEMQDLLDAVHAIVQKHNEEEEARYRNGDAFNVFSILNLRENEVRTHSAFLAELLNPSGSHGMKDTFLKAFLNNLECFKGFTFLTNTAKVTVEYYIGPYNEDMTDGGRIDILITSGKKAIVIENKIYAGDQPSQLIRYSNFARQFEDFRLLYLTLDGHVASEFSAGKLVPGEDYYTVSYKQDGCQWLLSCMRLSKDKPLVTNTLTQYLNLIKELTNQMNTEEYTKDLLRILCNSNNIEKSAIILDLYSEISDNIWKKCLNDRLTCWAKKNNYEITFDDPDIIEEGCLFGFRPESWANHWLTLQLYRNTYYYFGILKKKGKPHKTMELNIFSCGTNYAWPFGWERVNEVFDSNEKVANGEALEYIKKTTASILQELEERTEELNRLKITL